MISIIALVFIFISKVRFPRNKSLQDVVIERYGVETLRLFRRNEALYFKCSKTKMDLKFLRKCLDHKVFPTFLNFKTSNNGLRSSRAYTRCKRILLEEEIRSKVRCQRKLEAEHQAMTTALKSQVRRIDYAHLQQVTENRFNRKLSRISRIHDAKLLRLRLQLSPSYEMDPDRVIFNLSARTLTICEKKVLSKGLDFCMPPKRLDFAQYLCPFEKLYRDLRLLPVLDSFTISRTKVRLQDSAYNALFSYNSNNLRVILIEIA